MTKYSDTAKRPDQYVKGLREHWKRRRDPKEKHSEDKRDTAVNECWRPSAGASKADLAEYHAENMRSRRRRQRGGGTTVLPERSRSIALGNRNIRNIKTGVPAPHEHRREIARRNRQRAR